MAEERVTTSKESTVKDFLEVIFRRKWLIVGIVAVATVMVLFLNMREPAVYESVGRLMVRRGEAAGVFSANVRVLSWEEEMASQIELIKSNVVSGRAQEIVSRYLPEGYETEERISVWRINSGVVGTSNVLWIAYSSSDPVFCRAAADAVIKAYQEYYLYSRTPPEMEDFFSQEMNSLKDEIAHLRAQKTKLESESGIVDMEKQVGQTLNRHGSLVAELDEVERDIREYDEMLNKLEYFRTLDIDEQAALSNTLQRQGAKQTALEKYTERLMDLRMDESELAVKYTDNHRDLKQVRKQIEDLYGYIDKEINSFSVVTRAERDLLETKKGALIEKKDELERQISDYPEMDVRLHSIQIALKRAEDNYTELSAQQMNARLSKASNPEWNVTILSPASPAGQKKTVDYVRMALGPLFSLIVALGFAFFIDNLDHSIKNVAEAEEKLGCQVLASFPDSEQ